MIRRLYPLIAIAAAAALVACGDKPPQLPQTNVSPSASNTSPLSPAITPPVMPTPQPTATGTNTAETARDTAATNPKEKMSEEQESKSMPRSGQAGSISSTALDAKDAQKK